MPPPRRTDPPENWKHFELWKEVKDALYALPTYFVSETVISGIQATDIFTLSAPLSATIEEQMVSTLNGMRAVWDPRDKYHDYSFIRKSQTFPDVVLKRHHPKEGEDDVIMGTELKGWYLIAKEGEPSYRFKTTPSACAQADIIAVVPWALSNVISGTPKVFEPWVESARYAAEYRNYWWRQVRHAKGSTEIRMPDVAEPYPEKADQVVDVPAADAGNFGRLARTGLMDDYLEKAKGQVLSGIEARHWLAFFKKHESR